MNIQSYGDQCKTGQTDRAKYLKEQGKGEPLLCVCQVCIARGRGELPTSWSPVANINIRRDLMMPCSDALGMYDIFMNLLRLADEFVVEQAKKLRKNEISINEAYREVMKWLKAKRYSQPAWHVIYEAVR